MGAELGISKFDEKTQRWMNEHPWVETTVARCVRCGEYYKPNIGHICRQLKTEQSNGLLKFEESIREIRCGDWQELKVRAEHYASLGYKVSVNGWDAIRNNIMTLEVDA